MSPAGTGTRKPLERAQVVWERARELADPTAQHDQFAVALELLRAAHHDPTAMSHALALGQTSVSADGDDAKARGGVKILERAIAFLGVKPSSGTVGRRRRR